MAQASALEVMIQAHNITNDEKYLRTAKNLLNAFFIEVKEGGVTRKVPNDGWWYELYASPEAVESRVLNGHTASLLGIYKYYQYTLDPAAKYLFDQGVASLKKNLPRYEYVGGQYSTYDILNKAVASPPLYHIAQTDHLGQLYEITGEEIFKTYHDKWTKFKLPESVAEGKRIYLDPGKIELSLVPADEYFFPIQESNLTIRKIENSTVSGNTSTKFRIDGDGGNNTSRFTSSQSFYYIGRNISITLGNQIPSFTNMNISFAVIEEGIRDETNVIFVHGRVKDGWRDDVNYLIRIDSNTSKSITVKELFGLDDEYMVVKHLGVAIPKKACVNSMEFEVNFN